MEQGSVTEVDCDNSDAGQAVGRESGHSVQ